MFSRVNTISQVKLAATRLFEALLEIIRRNAESRAVFKATVNLH